MKHFDLKQIRFAAMAAASMICAGTSSCITRAGNSDGVVRSMALGEASSAACACYAPAGFEVFLSAPGVNILQRSANEYLTVVDLRYATLRNLTGDPSGGNVGRLSESDFWTKGQSQDTTTRKLRVVLNGTFFDQSKWPAPIAYGLKKDGDVLSYGYARPDTSPDEFASKVKLFTFRSSASRVWMGDWNTGSFSISPDVVSGLTWDAVKDYPWPLGTARTFVAIADQDCDGTPETAIFYTSSSHADRSRKEVNSLLMSIGASATMMLDGGSSTFLMIDQQLKIPEGKGSLPHAIGIYSGK
jgi:hypothetical protein